MSYQTHFNLHWTAETPTLDQVIEELIVLDLQRIQGKTPCDSRRMWTDMFNGETASWRRHEADLAEISNKYPDATFTLDGHGEQVNDVWRKYFRAGAVQEVFPDTIYPQFDKALTRKPKAQG